MLNLGFILYFYSLFNFYKIYYYYFFSNSTLTNVSINTHSIELEKKVRFSERVFIICYIFISDAIAFGRNAAGHFQTHPGFFNQLKCRKS